jgi:hypothetical protein
MFTEYKKRRADALLKLEETQQKFFELKDKYCEDLHNKSIKELPVLYLVESYVVRTTQIVYRAHRCLSIKRIESAISAIEYMINMVESFCNGYGCSVER